MITTRLGGWGRYPVERCHVFRPERRAAVAEALASKTASSFIARGLGRSYGDAALNADGGVIVHDRLDRVLDFDESTGLLHCEAGVSFADILAWWLPRGWFPPVTPGTKFVTVGGAIAADVHGKNHHRDGTLGASIESLTLLTADGETLRCSRTEHADVFWATVGGMGLTGMILDARLSLRPVESAWLRVDYRKARDLDETLAVFAASDAESAYSVAWIDCLARGRATGRAVLMHGDHATAAEARVGGRETLALAPSRGHTVPFDVPSVFLNPLSVRLFNGVYYAAHRDETSLVHFERFFYPLDGLSHWNRLYGRRGFVQYQVVLPTAEGPRGLVELLDRLSASGRPSFLAVLKRLGPANPGMLSFPREGYTLALDLPVRDGLVDFLQALDRLVLARGGRIYLAKDATTTPEAFREMYPRLDEFRALKARLDPRGVISSSLARRLGIVGSGGQIRGAMRFATHASSRVRGSSTVLMLGGTSTIARAIAAELAQRGYDLALAGRDTAELGAVAADLRARHGVKTSVHVVDALDVDGHAAALRPALTKDLRGVVLAIGYLGDQRRAETDPAEARRILDTNLTGCVSLLTVVAAHLAASGGGFVCALSSVAGDRGRQSNYVYGAAKAGLTTYLGGLRNRYARDGVRVLTVKAGVVDTRMSAGMPGAGLAASPERVARSVVRAITGGREVVYVPWFWRGIMLVIRAIPERVFKRLRL